MPQIAMVLSYDPVTKDVPDGWKEMDRIQSEWAEKVWKSFVPLDESQTMMDLSTDPDTMHCPSGE